MRLVLLHSPLINPVEWHKLAPLLEAKGHDVSVPGYRHVLEQAPPYYEKIAREIARQSVEPSVLIVHSGAGALVPVLEGAVPLQAAIFVDALLPHPGKCWFDTVPEAVAAHLRSLETDGHLPPWNRWWPGGALEAMLPDPAMRAAFIASLPSVPIRYFEEPAPAASLQKEISCAYLQLSSGYDAEANEVRNCGWPTRRLALNHLAMLTHPGDVANELCCLLQTIV